MDVDRPSQEADAPSVDLESVWRALSDPTRRRILDELRSEPCNTMGLVDRLGDQSRHNVIGHLKTLEAAGLVRVEARGRERINHLNATPLQEIHERWLSPFERIWAGRLFGLARAAEFSAAPLHQQRPPEHDMTNVRQIEITQEVRCQASPAAVWRTMTEGVASWWGPPYVDEASTGLEVTLAPGGTVWDRRSADSGYAVGLVRGYAPERELVLDGDFGIPGALHGRVVFTIEPLGDDECSVRVDHTAIGAIPDGGDDGHRHGWADLLARLAAASA